MAKLLLRHLVRSLLLLLPHYPLKPLRMPQNVIGRQGRVIYASTVRSEWRGEERAFTGQYCPIREALKT